jgi:adenosylmethionine-8-amino-7-oxononanoate aminotransferase
MPPNRPARAERAPTPAQRYDRGDKQLLWHPFTQQWEWEKDPALVVASARGIYFKDLNGRRYLDGVSSLWVNIHGHRHPILDRALRDQLKKMAHTTFLGLTHQPAVDLARELVRVAPPGLKRVFYSDNGATAVEVALKMAFQYWIETSPKSAPVRSGFLALRGSYHGDTLGAVSVGSIGAFHSKFKPLLFKARFAMAPKCAGCPYNRKQAVHRTRLGERILITPKPGDARAETGCRWECLGSVEKILEKEGPRLAAAIIEPVMQGAGGMIALPPGYVAGFARLVRRHNVLLISDEVATGFGRTGTLFAGEQENLRPDFMCVAKGLTGGYSPLAATLTTERVFQAFRAPYDQFKTFFHGHSYTAHPLGCAVAIASLRLIKSSKLLEKTRRNAHVLRDELALLSKFPFVGSVRQAGLMAGVELSTPPARRIGARVCRRLLEQGLWLRPIGNTIVVMPPLIISERALRRLVRGLGASLRDECGA